MFFPTPDCVRFALVTNRTRRSATASLACIFAPASVRFAEGQCHRSMPADGGERLIGLVPAERAARALQRLHDDADRDTATHRRLQRRRQRLKPPGRVGHQQQLPPGLADDVGEDGGGRADRDVMRTWAAPHGLDGHLGRALRVPGGQAGQVGQAGGPIHVGERVKQGCRVRRRRAGSPRAASPSAARVTTVGSADGPSLRSRSAPDFSSASSQVTG